MGVQFILFMGIDLGIKLLTMRRMGLWQRLRAAPLSRAFLLTSQVASGAIIAGLLFTGIFAAGMLFFGVRVDGSAVGFAGLIVAFACMTAAFGLFIAALGKTPEATRGLAIFATLVMVMLGGAWVPAFVFPQWLQTVSLVMPTRWAVDGFDAVTWRGLGFDAAWLPIVVLLLFTLVFGLIAVWRFNWDEK
jgi:ABC-2 type transport system permease protein